MAVPGEVFDGHDFVWSASQAGASAALISKDTFKDEEKLPKDFQLLKVTNTTEALRSLAREYRKKLGIPIFAVAGSNGKTTTKELIAFLLKEYRGAEKIFKTEKSNNSILGIALSLLQIRNETHAVIEIGIDEPGWMEQHLEIVRPTHGLITTIAEEHLNRLKNIETIANEELGLWRFLSQQSGCFIANLDCPWIRDLKLREQDLSYSLETTAEIEGLYIKPSTLHAFGFAWNNPLPGKHNAMNLLASLAALRALCPEIDQAALKGLVKKIEGFHSEPHRSRLHQLPDNIRVLDDCYNANPDSMTKAFEAFGELFHGGVQKIIIGDMLDLGASSEQAHRNILNLALTLPFDRIYLFGPEFEKALLSQAQKPKNVSCFREIDKLSERVMAEKKAYDHFLIKGSRGMKLERVLKSVFSI